ncbi:MAG: hypothetical protein HY078_06095 [Elusimicrobia bacterium]|nr:hypothetical protein [Elusimicrobiota bacterium]
MRTSSVWRKTAAAALLAALPVAASAKIVFTGYGDLRYNTGLRQEVTAAPATAAAIGAQTGSLISRGFSADAIGLFAATEVQENLQFLTDITFRRIGTQVNQLSLQYAYLHWTPLANTAFNAGKLTLPFGYYNENRFYSFQRTTIIAPVFASGILGLPIADWGVSGSQQLPLKGVTPELTAYVVNGYGSVPGTKTSMRSAALPGGLALANNIGATDNNNKPSVGTRLRLKEIGGAPVEVGASYYYGLWDSSALEPMTMVGSHAHASAYKFDVIAEILHLNVRGDQGFVRSIGDTSWSSTGGFVVLAYQAPPVLGKAITPYLQGEYFRSKPNNGDAERETMRTLTGGAMVRLSNQVQLKGEYLHLIYEIPDRANAGFLRLDADGAFLSLVVTF